LSYAGQCQDT